MPQKMAQKMARMALIAMFVPSHQILSDSYSAKRYSVKRYSYSMAV